jgi:ubiquinone/menaquinone biosynthesis C-methylase UbiE
MVSLPASQTVPHVAFDTWEARGETLESVEARIHDGVPAADLRARAVGYLQTLETFFDEARPKEGARILEIGTGVGYVLEAVLGRYAPSKVIGLDIAQGMIDLAKQRFERDGVDTSAVEFIHYDGVNVPLPDSSLDHGIITTRPRKSRLC